MKYISITLKKADGNHKAGKTILVDEQTATRKINSKEAEYTHKPKKAIKKVAKKKVTVKKEK